MCIRDRTDVDQMLKDAGLESQSAEIKAWYDGYHFGDADIYLSLIHI